MIIILTPDDLGGETNRKDIKEYIERGYNKDRTECKFVIELDKNDVILFNKGKKSTIMKGPFVE